MLEPLGSNLLLAPILLMGEKIPHNKGRHFPFHMSQLDSRTFGVAGPTGLWTRYHSKLFVWFCLELKNKKKFQLRESLYSNQTTLI